MKLDVITLDGGKAGQIELSDAIFGIDEIRGDILRAASKWQLAKRRAGTHKVQTRNENSRTGKKMYKQKGTGGARHGSRRAPQFVGGSRAFGPVVRSHEFDLPKKVRALALRHALSSKVKAGDLIVLDDAAARNAQDRRAAGPVREARPDQRPGHRRARGRRQFRAGRAQHPAVDVLPNAGLNVYDVLRRQNLVLTRAADRGDRGPLR